MSGNPHAFNQEIMGRGLLWTYICGTSKRVYALAVRKKREFAVRLLVKDPLFFESVPADSIRARQSRKKCDKRMKKAAVLKRSPKLQIIRISHLV